MGHFPFSLIKSCKTNESYLGGFCLTQNGLRNPPPNPSAQTFAGLGLGDDVGEGLVLEHLLGDGARGAFQPLGPGQGQQLVGGLLQVLLGTEGERGQRAVGGRGGPGRGGTPVSGRVPDPSTKLCSGP